MINLAGQIIEGCKKQDLNAQKQFYNMFYKMVYNSCYRILMNPMDAEDCMQESFLKAFNKIETLMDSPPAAWLRRIAINTSLDKLKQEKVDWVEIDESHNYGLDEEPEDDDDHVWKVEQIKIAMGKLPGQYRLILNLYLIEGYDHEEIAEILKLKVVTVRSQYVRAKQKLIGIVKEEKRICV